MSRNEPVPLFGSELIFPHDNVNLSQYEKKELEGGGLSSPKLRDLHNKFKGKRCFIIGNGPSLNKNDLSLLEGEYTFAVNSIYYKTRETGFRPTFFVVEDNMVLKDNLEEINAYEAPFKIFPSKYQDQIPEKENTYFFRANWGYYQKSSPYYCMPRFSVDATNQVYCGQTVTYANMQLAFFMGFTEVYLIGMDFDYVIPKEHLRNGNHILSTTDDPNHFHKDYFGKGKTWKDPKLDRVAASYVQAKLAFDAVGRRIYNATVGGKLEIFDRVDYEALLRDPSTGRKRVEQVAPVVLAAIQQPVVAAPLAKNSVAPPSPARPVAQPSISKPIPAPTYASPPQRRFYAGVGEWLRTRSPGPFRVLQSARRGLADIPQASNADGRGSLASDFREKSPMLYRLLQLAGWSLRAAWRHKAASLLLLALSIVLLALPLFHAPAWTWRYGLWVVVGLLVGTAAAAAILREAFRRIVTAFDAALSSAVRTARQTADKRPGGIEKRLGDIEKRLVGQTNKLEAYIEELRSQAEQTGQAADKRFGDVGKRLVWQTNKLETHIGELRREAEQAGGIAKAELEAKTASLGAEIEKVKAQPSSLDIVSALRPMRSLWFGGSALDELSRQPEVEHGHSVLMAALADAEREHPGLLSGKTLVEIGTTRERDPRQGSTEKLAVFTALTGMQFVTVDMDAENTKHAARTLRYLNPSAQAVTDRGEDYLAHKANTLDFVYLDAFDFDHQGHSPGRLQRYQEMLGTTIDDEACWKMHEDCARSLVAKMPEGGIVALDDTWTDAEGNFAGKGRLAIPLLLNNGFSVLAKTRMTVVLKRQVGTEA